ncbi:MAG: hypothetical protein LBT84_00220 [Spirochaetia bacterium]|jgi:hypothetical protein|nr:hypothetical protein [Spirochaetia bacterium]
MEKINSFGHEVQEKLGYYVYRLIDPRNGETFYVGKGKGNRVFQHVKGAIDTESDEDEITAKIKTIHEIIKAGLDVIHVIHRHAMDEKTAFEVESALIDAYPGTTNILEGSGANDYGPMHVKEIIEKYSSQEAEFKHKCILIIVNRSIQLFDLYEAVRKAWKINITKARQAEYVLALDKGMIRGVFKPEEWYEANEENFKYFSEISPGRHGFVGTRAEKDIEDIYIGKRIPDSFKKKGVANSVRYTF